MPRDAQPFNTTEKPAVYPHKISGSAAQCYAAEFSSTIRRTIHFVGFWQFANDSTS